MSVLIAIGYIIFVAVLLLGIGACLLGMPGTVLIFLDGLVFSAFTHWERPSGWMLLFLGLLSLAAETLDNVLSVAATRYGSGSLRTGWMAMLGGIGGALVGSWLGSLLGAIGWLAGPVGFLVAIVLVPLALALGGGFYAAYLYELHQGKSAEEARKAGWGALLGRLAGTMGKALLAVIMSGMLLWSVFLPHS